MSADDQERRAGAFSVLRRFARPRAATERCDLCSRPVAHDHQHLVEPGTRRLVCVCDACAVLFPGGHQKYKRVPRDIRLLPEVTITDAQWESLLIPIGMAFFYDSSPAGRIVAVYPSPAGATESQLPLETWQDIVRDNPVLSRLQPDVEALVANRLGHGGGPVRDIGTGLSREYFILPIDECFKLVGLIRLHWKGLSGGTDVWSEIARFFAGVRARAISPPEVLRA